MNPDNVVHNELVFSNLLEACQQNDLARVNLIISKDSSLVVRSTHYEGTTALHIACAHGFSDIVQCLMGKGASVSMATIDGSMALHEAVCGGWVSLAEMLITAYAAPVNSPMQQTTPLHEAVIAGKLDCTVLLLSHGASVHAFDCAYGTALHAACNRGHTNIAKALLDAGSIVNEKMTHSTPLHMVCEHHPTNSKLIALLCIYGADLWATDRNGNTPVDIATVKLEQSHDSIKILNCYMSDPERLANMCYRNIHLLCHKIFASNRRDDYLMKLPVSNNLKLFLCGDWIIKE